MEVWFEPNVTDAATQTNVWNAACYLHNCASKFRELYLHRWATKMATDQLSMTFAALADPTRRAILAKLTDGEATVGELAEPFEISLPSVSKHLTVLERAGLISKSRKRQERWCRLDARPLRGVNEWSEIYRAHWEGSLTKLAAHLDKGMKND